jgi:hypothetical protein
MSWNKSSNYNNMHGAAIKKTREEIMSLLAKRGF